MRLRTISAAVVVLQAMHVVGLSSPSRNPTLTIEHVTVIDGTGALPRPNLTVVLVGDRIERIEPTAPGRPTGPDVLDGTGAFLVPGFRDMHVHLGEYDAGRRTLESMLASGIVGVRDMASPLEDVLRLRADVRAGTIPGPAIVAPGPILQGPLPFEVPPLVRPLKDASHARAVVAELRSRGVDFIKIGDTLPRDVYFAVADEASRRGLRFGGHVPPSVTAAEASRAGQRSIEHFGSATFHAVLIACSSEEVALGEIARRALADAMAGRASLDETLFGADFTSRLVRTYDARKAASLFATFAEHGTWVVPTLTALDAVWDEKRSALNSRDLESGAALRAKYAALIPVMRAAGVKILAGTDVPPGSGESPLHAELVRLVSAGLTPLEALQSATRNAAEFLGTLAAEGTIEVGKRADLALLAANPLDDIANTRRIVSVIRRGSVVERKAVAHQ